jgi:hypothetical protein
MPAAVAVEHRLDGLLEGHAAGEQLRRHAHLGVHDAVRGQVQGALAGHPVHGVGPLHHADGVRERLQVAHQRAGVGRPPEPQAQRRGVVGRQVAVAELVGQLEHGLRAQAAVQVVVQENLGGAAEGLGVQWCGHAGKLPRQQRPGAAQGQSARVTAAASQSA